MADPDAHTAVMPAADAGGANLPSAPAELQDHLPGLEPERRITDWGRSERVETLIDRTIYGFLFHYWFRVEVEGIENVPAEGGALLVANRSGALPGDAGMIAKAIAQRHPRSRPVHFVADRRIRALPGLGTLAMKAGAVPDHPANVRRLLLDEGQLVLSFPEGARGSAKPVKDRYHLREFGDAAFVRAALEAGAPIVPVAILGGEEARPVVMRLNILRRLTRLPSVPVAPALPLPAKFRIRFLDPVATDAIEQSESEERALRGELRALIQENLLEMVAQRRSVWLG